MNCWGCNKDKISLFTWLAGHNLCKDCIQKPTSAEVTKNYIQNSKLVYDKQELHKEKALEQSEKVTKYGKNILDFVLGGAAFLWLIIMLPTQPDFIAILIGWAIIAGVYFVFRIASHL